MTTYIFGISFDIFFRHWHFGLASSTSVKALGKMICNNFIFTSQLNRQGGISKDLDMLAHAQNKTNHHTRLKETKGRKPKVSHKKFSN
jgi:hypothetical protein